MGCGAEPRKKIPLACRQAGGNKRRSSRGFQRVSGEYLLSLFFVFLLPAFNLNNNWYAYKIKFFLDGLFKISNNIFSDRRVCRVPSFHSLRASGDRQCERILCRDVASDNFGRTPVADDGLAAAGQPVGKTGRASDNSTSSPELVHRNSGRRWSNFS